MAIELEPEELEEHDVIATCPECGHAWTDDLPEHYHDCRYFEAESEEEDEEAFVLFSPADSFHPGFQFE